MTGAYLPPPWVLRTSVSNDTDKPEQVEDLGGKMGAHKCGCAFFMEQTIDRAHGIDDISDAAKERFARHCQGPVNQITGLLKGMAESRDIECYFLMFRELRAIMQAAREDMKSRIEKELGHPVE